MLGFLKSFSSNIHYKYSIQSRPSFEAGCWTVFDAKHKTTNDPVSVFVFNKKAVADVLASNGIKPRSAVLAEVWEFATRGVQQLTKIRHPAVLKLVEPLESTKSSMTFVTERIVGSIDTVHESDLDELSVVRGLSSVIQALQFLHTQLGMVHGNINPKTVFADLQGDWKIAGLEFLVNFEEFTPGNFHLPMLDPRMPMYMHPSYDYLAPELVLHKTVIPANDVWSLACLLYAIYVRRSPLQTRNNPSGYKEELVRFQGKLNSAQTTSKFPVNLRPYLASLFCEDPDGRMTIPVLETTDFFQNPLIKALKAMDEFTAKPAEEKVSFLKHFQTLIPQFPKQMRLRKIVKFATKELSGPRDPTTGLLLANVLFTVCADMSRLSFQEQVLPLFTQLADYLPFQESVSSNLEVITRSTADKDFSKSVLPVLVDALKFHDAQHVAVQARILSSTEVYAANITVSKLEQTFFAAVIDCFAATPARTVKIAATNSLGVLVHRGVSKAMITDRLVPALKAMKTRDPSVVVAVAKLWKEVCVRLNCQQIFTLALPQILELSLAKQLTVDQFKQFLSIAREQIDAVEKEQTKELIHNQPHEEDDWLSEPVSTTALPAKSPQDSASLPAPPILDSPSPLFSSNTTATNATAKPSVLSAKPVATQQRSQKLPDLPAPKASFGQTQKTTPLQLGQPKPQVSAKVSNMPALVPSSSTLTPTNKTQGSQVAAPGTLMSFTPLQPQKQKTPAQQSSVNDEFGSFVSTNPNPSKPAANNNQFESLI